MMFCVTKFIIVFTILFIICTEMSYGKKISHYYKKAIQNPIKLNQKMYYRSSSETEKFEESSHICSLFQSDASNNNDNMLLGLLLLGNGHLDESHFVIQKM